MAALFLPSEHFAAVQRRLRHFTAHACASPFSVPRTTCYAIFSSPSMSESFFLSALRLTGSGAVGVGVCACVQCSAAPYYALAPLTPGASVAAAAVQCRCFDAWRPRTACAMLRYTFLARCPSFSFIHRRARPSLRARRVWCGDCRFLSPCCVREAVRQRERRAGRTAARSGTRYAPCAAPFSCLRAARVRVVGAVVCVRCCHAWQRCPLHLCAAAAGAMPICRRHATL